MIAVGEKAPLFEAEGTVGPVSLASLLEKGPVVVYFFPRANTPGCTLEGVEFNHLLEEFHGLGVEVVGISVDAPKTQAGFAAKHGFRFPMIGDKERRIGPLYGVMKNPDGTGSTERDTVVVGKDGVVVLAYQKMKGAGHAAKVLEDVKAAREAGKL